MKINEVEAIVGVTKKNIRFYEEQGLLSPNRNKENGYREYSDNDVHTLLCIKLMRKLGVPVEEIRKMQRGIHTVSDGMQRHIVSLEREHKHIQQSIQLCTQLQKNDGYIDAISVEEYLRQIEQLEKQGAMFRNRQNQDVAVHYIAPAVIASMFILFMLSFIGIIFWEYATNPEGAPPTLLLCIMVTILLFAIAGVVLAFIQRVKEIGKGEIDDARKY